MTIIGNRLALAVATAALIVPTAAAAQIRAQSSSPMPPLGVQRPNVSLDSQAMAALNLKIDGLRQSVGRQIVVLSYTPLPITSWEESDNSFPSNHARAEKWCRDALGDRFGRVVSRLALPADGRWFFPNLVCETAP